MQKTKVENLGKHRKNVKECNIKSAIGTLEKVYKVVVLRENL